MYFSFSYHPYIAIIGDIKYSKKIVDRQTTQHKLDIALEEINNTYVTDISSKFMITLGDEFQGLLCTGEHVFSIIEEIQHQMYPIGIRFGIGVGAITTKINAQMAIGADGPGYYNARYAIDLLKKNEQKKQTVISDIRIEIDQDQHGIAPMLNAIFSLVTMLKKNWTTRQREIIWDYIKHQDGQERTANRLGIAQSSVQRGLDNGNYYTYKNTAATIGSVLGTIGRTDV